MGDEPILEGQEFEDIKKQPGCPGCTVAGWKLCMQVTSLILVICAIVVVVIAVIVGANSNSIQRYCLSSVPVTGNADPSGNMWGYIQMDVNADNIAYNLYYTNLSSLVSIKIYGPLLPPASSASIYFSICGDTISCSPPTGGFINGTLDYIYVSGVVEDPYSFMVNVRANPALYYVQIDTANSASGAIRAYLNTICGTSI